MEQFSGAFTSSHEAIEVIRYSDVPSFSELLSHSAALITDYSSISFDVAYLRRPAVYYTFREAEDHNKNDNADLGLYAAIGTIAEDATELEQVLRGHAAHQWKIDEQTTKAIDDFFAFDDQHNRERIVDAIRNLT
jgi:CDP-glycerol glycerophosphotransferase (TagB/SpsB family)